jgi:hypothetical protein
MVHATHINRRAVTARAVAAMAMIAVLASAGAGVASAQPSKAALVGSWLETVSFPPEAGRPPLKSLSSFHLDGTMTCSDQGAVTTEGPFPVAFTSCHGVWTHLEQRKFAYTAFELISDLSGNLVGYLKVRGIYTLSHSGNEYSGSSHAEVLDTDGNVLQAIDVTNTGQRIQLELP